MKVRRLTGHRFQPRRIIADFENSIQAAVHTELPHTQLSNCYFHFCQSLWRRIQGLGLARPYARRRKLRKCLRKFMALGYLPVPLVRQNFFLHAGSQRTLRLVRRYPVLRDFITYVQANYIDGQYTPPSWNVYNRDNDNRTNNHVEGKDREGRLQNRTAVRQSLYLCEHY